MNKNKNISILSACTSGGCGAKLDPAALSGLLSAMPVTEDPRLLVGFGGSDDAAVYEIEGDLLLISTTDFFSPMVDDPYIFGKIAAANALSDVYAMGGKPLLALNLVCFPEALPLEILGEILRGGAEKIKEAGASLAGGHSVYDKEPKYGLAVTGVAKKNRLLRNNTPRVGDILILTKPLGTGVVMAAHRAGLAAVEAVEAAVASMERLNKYASERLSGYNVSACTDITGFGLGGHGLEMAGDKVTLRIDHAALPLLPMAADYAGDFLITAAGQRNRLHSQGRVNAEHLPFALQELVFDPQTSGGLLIAAARNQAGALLEDIRANDPKAAIIGDVEDYCGFSISF